MSYTKQVVGFGLYDSADQELGVAIVKSTQANWQTLLAYKTANGKPVAPISTKLQYFATEAARKVAIDKFVAAAKAKAKKELN